MRPRRFVRDGAAPDPTAMAAIDVSLLFHGYAAPPAYKERSQTRFVTGITSRERAGGQRRQLDARGGSALSLDDTGRVRLAFALASLADARKESRLVRGLCVPDGENIALNIELNLRYSGQLYQSRCDRRRSTHSGEAATLHHAGDVDSDHPAQCQPLHDRASMTMARRPGRRGR